MNFFRRTFRSTAIISTSFTRVFGVHFCPAGAQAQQQIVFEDVTSVHHIPIDENPFPLPAKE